MKRAAGPSKPGSGGSREAEAARSLPQTSSGSRFTPRAGGFLTVSQRAQRPQRQGDLWGVHADTERLSLRFHSGFAGRRDRKPAPGMTEFGLLHPSLRLSVLNRGTDFALVQSRVGRYLTNPAIRCNGIPSVDESLEKSLCVSGCILASHCVILIETSTKESCC
jgi:hypothetical protein